MNYGFEYLHGFIFQNQTTFFQVVSITIVVLTIGILGKQIFIFFQRNSLNSFHQTKSIIVLISLFASLAIPVIVTIRIEHRWYLSSYILLIFILFLNLDTKFESPKRLVRTVWFTYFFLATYVCLNLFMNITYIQRNENLYFMFTQRSVKAQLVSLEKIFLTQGNFKKTIYVFDPDGRIDFRHLNFAIDANLIDLEIDVVQVANLDTVPKELSMTVIEFDPDKLDGSFREIRRD